MAVDKAEAREQALRFLAGEKLSFQEADGLWRQFKSEPSLARLVLERIRTCDSLSDGLPEEPELLDKLCQQHALLTGKDLELNAGVRHDRALQILGERFDLARPQLDGDPETLGIAGGIHKRRFDDLGQVEDLRRSARYYQRAAAGPLGEDAYTQINAAFLEDLLADTGDEPDARRARADALRRRIVTDLEPQPDNWWNVATRAEAHVGLGDYPAALAAIRVKNRPEPWELQTTALQLARLARLRASGPLDQVPGLNDFFKELLGGSAAAVRSTLIGRVGMGLSGGGLRASFYHLGVLARLAELDVLRHLEVLSCVSGGSIVGACYWLALRRRLSDPDAGGPVDYPALVRQLIEHFEAAVGTGLREQIQGRRWKRAKTARNLWQKKGALDSEAAARLLEEHFYRPLMPGDGTLFMDQLDFEPPDHDPSQAGGARFEPTRHNWLRTDNVPVLVLNATTVNTGHAWQFTPTWMGESPWSVQQAADTVPRLEKHDYKPDAGWRMPLAKAVSASACVPGVFAPLRIEGSYPDLDVELVDGGVYDNQGVAALLAHSCNVVLVSDAAGQLRLERHSQTGPMGLVAFFGRAMETLMERIRQAAYGDLSARIQSGLLRGLLYVHMTDGLDAEPIRLPFSLKPDRPKLTERTPLGIRRDFQQALAEIRTDLNRFTELEARSLMACGYRMTAGAFERDLHHIPELGSGKTEADWPFAPQLAAITTAEPLDDEGREMLETLRSGSEVPD